MVPRSRFFEDFLCPVDSCKRCQLSLFGGKFISVNVPRRAGSSVTAELLVRLPDSCHFCYGAMVNCLYIWSHIMRNC